MASRYGRNKKRRHRERIAELEKELAAEALEKNNWKKTANRVSSDLRQLHEALSRVTDYSVFLPPRVLGLDPAMFGHSPFRYQRRPPLRPVFLDSRSRDEPLTLDVRGIPVSLITARIERDSDRFETLIHFAAAGVNSNRGVRYIVSDEALRHARDAEAVFSRIAEQCTRDIIESYRKQPAP